MSDRKFCDGCDNDFYNGKNPMGVAKCWHLAMARVVTRYRIGWWTAPTAPGAFTKVQTHHCHTASGRYQHQEKLPDCAVGVSTGEEPHE